jgi:hypothetical protein
MPFSSGVFLMTCLLPGDAAYRDPNWQGDMKRQRLMLQQHLRGNCVKFTNEIKRCAISSL